MSELTAIRILRRFGEEESDSDVGDGGTHSVSAPPSQKPSSRRRSAIFPTNFTNGGQPHVHHPSFLPSFLPEEERQDARNFAHQLFIARVVRVASKHGIILDKPPQLRSVISPSLNEIFMASPDKRSPVITTMTLHLEAI